ncbi:hypothetical protein V1509DRAFT_640567 [Lipomyces kononenkoae]
MDIDQILNSSTAQSKDQDPVPPQPSPEPWRDNVSSVPETNSSPESLSERQHPEKQSSPASAPQYIDLPPLEISKSTAPVATSIPRSWPSGETPPSQQPILPQHHQTSQYQGTPQSYAYPSQYHQQRYPQYHQQMYYQDQTTAYHVPTAQHHIQPFQQGHYSPTGDQQFSFPRAVDQNYGESSSVSQWAPLRQSSSSQSIPQEHFAPTLDSSGSSITRASEGAGLRRLNSDADPQEETSLTAVKPKRRKAPNSTWTLEEDRKLVDMVLQTLPRQDFSEYAQILNKRDGQTVRYRWKVLVRRAKGENEDGASS